MVHAELGGGGLSRALQQQTSNATNADEKVPGECLSEISRAFFEGDVQFKTVQDMQWNVKRVADELATGHNKRRISQEAVVDEFCSMLDPSKPDFILEKGKPNVIMFVGWQGSGKTTTCTKYASHYRQNGWKPALVCADTFTTGAFDQLKQNAVNAKIPFYGSDIETDPVKLAREGVGKFKEENCDVIILDTSGSHKQEASQFEQIRKVAEVAKPDLVVFLMDSSVGQAVFDQAQAFKLSGPVGTVIVTKMVHGNGRVGGLRHVLSTENITTVTAQSQESLSDEVDNRLKEAGFCKESITSNSFPDPASGFGRDIETTEWILSAAKAKEQDDDEDDDDDDDEDDDEEEEEDEDDNKVGAGDDEEDLEAEEEEADDEEGEDDGEAEDNGEDDDGEEEGGEEDVDGDEDEEQEQDDDDDDDDGDQDPEEEDDDEAEGESEEDIEDIEPPKKKRK